MGNLNVQSITSELQAKGNHLITTKSGTNDDLTLYEDDQNCLGATFSKGDSVFAAMKYNNDGTNVICQKTGNQGKDACYDVLPAKDSSKTLLIPKDTDAN